MSSLWPPALVSLDDSLALPCNSLDELQAIQTIDVKAVIKHLESAAEAARDLRSWVLSVLPGASWQTREELDALVAEVQCILEARSRLSALATELEGGSIAHRRALRVDQLNQLREQAIKELRYQAESGGVAPTLPGPRADEWIDWACGLKEPDDAEALQTLRSGFPHLDDFVADLETGMWNANNGTEASPRNGVELKHLIQDVREQLRSRLLALATELERGDIVHHRALRVNQLNQLRKQSIQELRSQAGQDAEPPALPGPEVGQWIEWACGLKEPEDNDSIQTLRDRFARLDDFIANLEPDMWRAGEAAGSDVLAGPEKSSDITRQEPSREETEGFPDLEERSQSALAPDALTGDQGTPLQDAEVPEPTLPPEQLVGPVRMEVVTEPERTLDHQDEPGVATGDSGAKHAAAGMLSHSGPRFEKLWEGKSRVPLVVAAVLVLMALLGAILLRSHRRSDRPGIAPGSGAIASSPAPAAEIVPQLPPTAQSAQPDSKPDEVTSRPPVTAVPNDSARVETQPTAQSAKPNSKRDEVASRPSVMTVPNDFARVEKTKAAPNRSAETPDPTPPSLPGGAANRVDKLVTDVPAAQPKLVTPQIAPSSGEPQPATVLHQVAPRYPAQARAEHVQGVVVLQIKVGKDGAVQNVHVVSGNPLLGQAAEDAVKKWRFKPALVNGKPVEAESQVTVNFAF